MWFTNSITYKTVLSGHNRQGKSCSKGNGAKRGRGKGLLQWCQGHRRLFPLQLLLLVGMPGPIQDKQGHEHDPQCAESELFCGQGRELLPKFPGCFTVNLKYLNGVGGGSWYAGTPEFLRQLLGTYHMQIWNWEMWSGGLNFVSSPVLEPSCPEYCSNNIHVVLGLSPDF